MNDYSTLFTSGLMLLCDSTRPRSHIPPECSPTDDCTGLRSFLSLDMAESLRTFAASSSPRSSRPSSRKPSAERRSRAALSPAASSSKLDATPNPRATVSPVHGRRRSLPQPKPAPLAELPVLPTATHTRSRSDSAASAVPPVLAINTALESETAPGKGKSAAHREHLAPITSSLKLELSSAPTTPGSRFPTTPTSSRAISMFSPLTPPSADQSWFSNMDPTSPTESWPDAFASAISPTLTEGVLGLHFAPNSALGVLLESENVAPLPTVAPKRARVRRDRHSAPSRNASVSNSMRSSQASVTTSYRRAQRGGALARLEGRIPRSEWMSDEEEGLESAKYKSGLSLMPSMDFQSEYSAIPACSKAPFRSEDQNCSFIDLTDDVASLAARRAASSFAV